MGEHEMGPVTLPWELFVEMNQKAAGANAVINLIYANRYISTDDVLAILGAMPLPKEDRYAGEPDGD